MPIPKPITLKMQTGPAQGLLPSIINIIERQIAIKAITKKTPFNIIFIIKLFFYIAFFQLGSN